MAVTKKASASKAVAKKPAAPAKKPAVVKKAEPAKKLTAKPVAKPVAKSAVKPVAKPAAKPAVKPVAAKVAPVKTPAPVAAQKAEPKDVVFRVYSPDSKSVDIAGEFNNWDPSKGKMKKDKEGNWSLKVKLSKGSYQYKIVYDGSSWETDQKAPSVMAEHGQNSIVNVE